MRSFHELLVWQKAHQLTLNVYVASRGFPREELYGWFFRFKVRGLGFLTVLS